MIDRGRFLKFQFTVCVGGLISLPTQTSVLSENITSPLKWKMHPGSLMNSTAVSIISCENHKF